MHKRRLRTGFAGSRKERLRGDVSISWWQGMENRDRRFSELHSAWREMTDTRCNARYCNWMQGEKNFTVKVFKHGNRIPKGAVKSLLGDDENLSGQHEQLCLRSSPCFEWGIRPAEVRRSLLINYTMILQFFVAWKAKNDCPSCHFKK